MEVVLKRGDLAKRTGGTVALGIVEGVKRPAGAAGAMDRVTRGAITAALAAGDFRGKFLQHAVLYPAGRQPARLLLVGLGPLAELTVERVRHAAALAAGRARDLESGTLTSVVHGAGIGGLDPAQAAQACAEGSVLGNYRFTPYRTEALAPPLRRVEFVERDTATANAMRAAVERGARWAEAVAVARDLASTPGQDLTPAGLAARAKQIARATGARARVLGPPELERLGCGALLAVGRGSVNPPRLIVLERGLDARSRKPRKRPVVIIGKGVTFDTGGISLKPRENMEKMKYDMSGAAAVIAVFQALEGEDLPFPVVGVVPSAENMPGGGALKPGDIVRSMDGTTIEVTNTDAEGRLILADALGFTKRTYEPDVVVDLATLTGAVSIALGPLAAGLFTDDDVLAAELIDAGSASGERLWRLPVWDDYLTFMRGDASDLKNSAGREGGACVAAAFLKHFARGLRWAHLDIAGRAWSSTDKPHEPKGPTGFGVRLLLEWMARRAAVSAEGA